MELVAHARCRLGEAERLLRRTPPFERLCVTRLELTDTLFGKALNIYAFRNGGLPAVMVCIATLADALRCSSSITSLRCDADGLHVPPEALAVLLNALCKHPTLEALELRLWRTTLTVTDETLYAPVTAAAQKALCDLLEANAPALTTLRISNARLRDEQLVLLMLALEHNTRLRDLDLGGDSKVSSARVGSTLLRAVRAATALRELVVGADEAGAAAVQEAQAVLQARAAC